MGSTRLPEKVMLKYMGKLFWVMLLNGLNSLKEFNTYIQQQMTLAMI